MAAKLDTLPASAAADWWRQITRDWLDKVALKTWTPLETYARRRAAMQWIELPCRPRCCGGAGGLTPGAVEAVEGGRGIKRARGQHKGGSGVKRTKGQEQVQWT